MPTRSATDLPPTDMVTMPPGADASLLVAFEADNAASVMTATRREWLLTNGLGGYAMGTLPGLNTRRYHGLLVASAAPPVQRVVVLHSVIESIVTAGGTIELSTHLFADDDLLHPEGWRHLAEVRLSLPHEVSWTLRTHVCTVTRTLRVQPLKNEVEMNYCIEGNSVPVTLRLLPLMPLRDFHSLDAAEPLMPLVDALDKVVHVTRGRLRAWTRVDGEAAFHCQGMWWKRFAYPRDRERGQAWRDDVFSPGRFDVSIPAGGGSCRLVSALERPSIECTVKPPQRNLRTLALRGGIDESIMSRLRVAADQFVVRRRIDDRWTSSIIAGYPWFADWGRDSMICLPGLLLCTGRHEEALEVLHTFAARVRNGLIPNRFDDYEDDSHYNSVDASLWFIHAMRSCADHMGREAIDTSLMDTARSIINAFRRGISSTIRLDRDGLIAAGNKMTQLTWMDAKRGERVFTPRHGKPIEINALWHNALRSLADLTEDEGDRDTMRELAGRCAISMQMQFWWSEMSCCHDVLTPVNDGIGHISYVGDARLRPNQILAVSVPHSPLTKHQQRDVVRVVGQRLLTPMGLRTLDTADTEYRGRFEGDMEERDAAYHNGTVWPWLLGPYCEAMLRVSDFSEASKNRARALLQPLLDALDAKEDGSFNQLSEVYDGDEPRRPGGCVAQAWSVAEVFRVLSMIE